MTARKGHKAPALLRSSYTGECYQQSIARGGTVLIPAAVGDQCALEELAFYELIRRGDYYGYPGMLGAVRPLGGALELVVGYPGLAGALLYNLLPACRPGEHVEWGIPGLRIAGIGRNRLHLRWLAGQAGLTITGATTSVWRRYVKHIDQYVRSEEMLPLWNTASLHADERKYLDALYGRRAYPADGAWPASGMLRRIGLLNKLAFYAGNGWCRRDLGHRASDWSLDMYFAPGVERRDEEFIQALCDARTGLGLGLDHSMTNDRGYRQVVLRSAGREPARVDLRFTTDDAAHAGQAKILMVETGVPAARLDLIIPQSAAAAVSHEEHDLLMRKIHHAGIPQLPPNPDRRAHRSAVGVG
ncbi:hypothetical protein [Catenulispora rubra]|uniref:hypothetical protein n=1 Tax=Catenulispora rubra TaxID=280293 RepID=UPI00189279C1|nr:hypothetical protein [Catenulispora rubra]